MMSAGLPSVVFAGLALWCSACKTNTSGLELREPSAGGSSEGGTGGAELGGAGSVSLGGAGAQPDEPQPSEGPELSLVHGVVDGGRLVSCWLDPASGAPVGDGAVEPAAGLGFGAVHRKAIDWDVSSEARRVELFSLPAAAVPGASCASLLATPFVEPAPRDAGAADDAAPEAGAPDEVVRAFSEPSGPRRAGSLLLAAGALGAGKSYALISAGCATRGELDPGSCGERDSISGEHLSLLLVEVRYFVIETGLFGLQFVNASRSAGSLDVVLEPAQSGLPVIEIAREVALGSVRPRTAASALAPASVQLGTSGSGAFQYRQDWRALLDASGLGEVELGRSHLLAYLGPVLVPTAESVSGIAPPRLVLMEGPR